MCVGGGGVGVGVVFKCIFCLLWKKCRKKIKIKINIVYTVHSSTYTGKCILYIYCNAGVFLQVNNIFRWRSPREYFFFLGKAFLELFILLNKLNKLKKYVQLCNNNILTIYTWRRHLYFKNWHASEKKNPTRSCTEKRTFKRVPVVLQMNIYLLPNQWG